MKEFTIVPKILERQYLKDHPDIIFRNRELIVEKDGDGENAVYRFKIGDGVKPYSVLQYISSLYALYPNFHMYDKKYEKGFTVSFEIEKEKVDA